MSNNQDTFVLEDGFVYNTPNAKKLLESLRHDGYDTHTALADIVDNSLDAGAKKIDIEIKEIHGPQRDIIGGHQILISDNGSGMDMDTLDQALKLGSDTHKDIASDLGRFGMGLCTASISQAKKVEVITSCGEDVWYSCQDLDVISVTNKFLKELRLATEEEKTLLFSKCGIHGTVVRLTKIDRLSDHNINNLEGVMRRELGRVFRKFLASDAYKISINGKILEDVDPLQLKIVGESEVFCNEQYELPESILGKGKKISVKIVILPEVTQSQSVKLKVNMHSQGFYILRNNREIESGSHLGIFVKHPSLNRMRIELSFDASLDEAFGVRFKKDGVTPTQALMDFLAVELGGQITTIRKVLGSKAQAKAEEQVDHKLAVDTIAQQSKLLIDIPEVVRESRNPRTKDEDKDEKNNESDVATRVRTNFSKSKKSSAINARFETLKMGESGLLYDAEQKGKEIIIKWNSDHPFYKNMILKNSNDSEITKALDFLVFALASAELKYSDEDAIDMIQSIRAVASANLKTLMGN